MIAIFGHTIFYMATWPGHWWPATQWTRRPPLPPSSSSLAPYQEHQLQISGQGMPPGRWPENQLLIRIAQNKGRRSLNNYQDVEAGPWLFLLERRWLNIDKKIGGKCHHTHLKRTQKDLLKHGQPNGRLVDSATILDYIIQNTCDVL